MSSKCSAIGVVSVVVVLAAGCGGSTEQADGSHGFTASEPSGGGETSRDDGMEISGLMGTLEPGDVQSALQPKMQRFAGCFMERYDDLEVVGGRFEMAFRVRRDGSVLWV